MAAAVNVLVDSTVLIDALRGVDGALALVGQAGVAASELSRVEVGRGLRSGERTRFAKLAGIVRWIAVDEQIASRAAELGRAHRRGTPGIGTIDLVIAATAICHGLRLATHNVRHFPMFPEIVPPY